MKSPKSRKPSAKVVQALIPKKWCKSSAGDMVVQNYTADGPVIDGDVLLERLMAVHATTLAESALDPSQVIVGDGPDAIAGWDTEYYNDPDTGEKKIICSQIHLIGEGGELSDIHFSKNGERISLMDHLLRVLLLAMQRKIVRVWPRRIRVGAYFLRADLDSTTEFQEIKHRLDSAGGRICTIGKGLTYSLLPHALESLLDPATDAASEDNQPSAVPRRASALISQDGRLRLLSIQFLDMAAFTAMGTSLEDVGTQVGVEKVELGPENPKDRMDLLLVKDPALFEAYALADAKIVARFMVETMRLAKELTGSSDLSPTASAFAQKYFLQTLEDAGLQREACFGVEKIKTAVWSDRADRVRTITDEVLVPQREDHRAFVTKAYHGGMNMVMWSGPSELGDWRDWDLVSAYPSAMLSLRLIDYAHPRVSTNINDYMGDVVGFAHVEFDYDDPARETPVRQPGLPVDGGNRGLLYPRRGRSYCTAAELAVAVRLGCRITAFHHGVIFPWVGEAEGQPPNDVRIFEQFVRECRKRRSEETKGSVKEKLIKLCMSSLYGRVAMGIKEKRVFDTRSGTSVRLPQSPISNEIMAGHITGQIRATLAEVLANLPADRRALSVTTDGMICNCSLDELPLNGVMAQRYMDWAERATGKREIFEEKHRVRQVIVMKTRGQVTAEVMNDVAEDKQTILAKVGVSPPPEVKKRDHNAYMLELYLHRHPGQKTMIRPFISIRGQWSSDSGFIRLEREQRLNLEPDWKNRLIKPRMIMVKGIEHIACETEPWENAEQGLDARAIFDGWIRKNTLKTLEDWQSWQECYQLGVARRAKRRQGKASNGINMTEEGPVGMLRRMFLRAWSQETLRLEKRLSRPKMAALLTALGLVTTVDDVKNAGRSTHRFEEGVVPRTPEVVACIDKLRAIFPDAELERLLIPKALVQA